MFQGGFDENKDCETRKDDYSEPTATEKHHRMESYCCMKLTDNDHDYPKDESSECSKFDKKYLDDTNNLIKLRFIAEYKKTTDLKKDKSQSRISYLRDMKQCCDDLENVDVSHRTLVKSALDDGTHAKCLYVEPEESEEKGASESENLFKESQVDEEKEIWNRCEIHEKNGDDGSDKERDNGSDKDRDEDSKEELNNNSGKDSDVDSDNGNDSAGSIDVTDMVVDAKESVKELHEDSRSTLSEMWLEHCSAPSLQENIAVVIPMQDKAECVHQEKWSNSSCSDPATWTKKCCLVIIPLSQLSFQSDNRWLNVSHYTAQPTFPGFLFVVSQNKLTSI